jgi:phosphopantothenoylcysteine decarboxylase/phosphopantothenate--cysteine ligase
MSENNSRRIVLGITGGIAAYKSAELTRLLKKAGIGVQVAMTEAGCRFITPATLQALSGNAVFTDAWDARIDNHMPHIALSRDADAILIAPASADFLAKLANGLADDLLSTLCLARQPTCPLLVAPAMNREMWENAATQRNVARLRQDGVTILGPLPGDQACGETGPGRMMEPAELAKEVLQLLNQPAPSGMLAGIHVLVTAGPTFEPIDPVRGLTNRSTGKMGYAIAQSLLQRGAQVTLISGPTHLSPPAGCTIVRVETASQMFDAVKHHLTGVEMFFSVAAVADYAPMSPSEQKIKKASAELTLHLKPTTDILAWVAAQPDAPFCVGFAAESQNVVEYASKKREKKGIAMIVANHAPSAIGADDNEVTILDASGQITLPRQAKAALAEHIVSHAWALFQSRRAK